MGCVWLIQERIIDVLLIHAMEKIKLHVWVTAYGIILRRSAITIHACVFITRPLVIHRNVIMTLIVNLERQKEEYALKIHVMDLFHKTNAHMIAII
jgi:hypothetical protein